MAVSREIEENAMIRYFKTDNQRIQEEEKIGDGVWVADATAETVAANAVVNG